MQHESEPLDRARSNFESLIAYGWDDRLVDQYQPHSTPERIPGRITRVDRGIDTVASQIGTIRCQTRRPEQQVAVGDWVAVDPRPGAGFVVGAVLPRRSAITRADPANDRSQVLAANIDVVLVLHGLDRDLRPGLIERALVVAWDARSTPILVLTKSDLTPDGGERAIDESRQAIPGVDSMAVSNETGAGVDALAARLGPGVTAVAIGESGVGKSTLANRLLGDDDLGTGDTRPDGAGRHTTTARQLIPLPSGGVLIDTPGLRALGLWDNAGGVAEVFSGVEDFALRCRFRDCRHGQEPGCEVMAAVADGRVAQRRLDNYRRLLRELAHQAGRADEPGRRAEMKKRGKAYKSGKEVW